MDVLPGIVTLNEVTRVSRDGTPELPGTTTVTTAPRQVRFKLPHFFDDDHVRLFFARYGFDRANPVYSIPAQYVAHLAGPLVSLGHEMALFDAAGRVLEQSVSPDRLFLDPECPAELGRSHQAALAGPIREAPEGTVLAGAPWSHVYYHFLFEAIPRYLLACRIPGGPAVDPAFPVMLAQFLPFQVELADLIGIDPARRLPTIEGLTRHRRCHLPSRPSQTDGVAPELSADLKQALFPGLGIDPTPSRRSLLYISRSDAGARHAVNEDQVVSLLATRGFSTLACGEHRVAGQIRRFADARVVVGLHGSNLCNTIFCPPGSVLIELMPDQYVKFPYFFVTQSAGMRYLFLACPSLDPVTGARVGDEDERSFAERARLDVEVPLDKLAFLVDYALNHLT